MTDVSWICIANCGVRKCIISKVGEPSNTAFHDLVYHTTYVVKLMSPQCLVVGNTVTSHKIRVFGHEKIVQLDGCSPPIW